MVDAARGTAGVVKVVTIGVGVATVVVLVTVDEVVMVAKADIVVNEAVDAVGAEVVEVVVDCVDVVATEAGGTAEEFNEDTVLATTSSTATLGRAIVSATSSNAKSS